MWAKNVRYLDYNASSGITGSVRKKLIEILGREDVAFANPSSSHRLGQQSQQMLMKAGMKIASALGEKVEANQLIFTSSGTEANQTVIGSQIKKVDVVIIGSGEHSASHDLLSEVPEGTSKHELPLLSNGQYDLDFLRKILNDVKQSGSLKVFLSLFWANNETGVLTSVGKLEEVLRSSGLEVTLHLDGAQVWGKAPVELFLTPAHFVTFSSHKIGSPAGTGVIWVRPGSEISPLISGSQSRGLRGGTENLLSILALSFAVEELDPVKFAETTQKLRNQLENGLAEVASQLGHEIKIWGQSTVRIPNTTRFSVSGFKTYANWVELLDLKGFAVSHGSACKSKIITPSRVLMNMGATEEEALNAIRVSFSPAIQSIDVEEFLVAFKAILSEKRGQR